MKKIIIGFALLALSFCMWGCGGEGDSGSASLPSGENPGIPSVFKLLPTQYIAQTNGYIYFKAKVLDGNGAPVSNTPVTFTNLSPVGTLSTLNTVIANTDDLGIATAHLFSTTPGFVTILAQVYTGVGQIRGRKTVFFSANDVLAVSMDLDVDSLPGNGIYNEASDFILFDPPPDPDDEVEILATVRDAGGLPLPGQGIMWAADHTEVNFTHTEGYTDINGQATTIVQVTPETLRDTETHVSIYALASNGAFNMVTLFLQPVAIDTITVAADPPDVNTGDTSNITATVTITTGGPAPDGITVGFSTCDQATCTTPCGTIDPFAQTTDGIAEATFTAPSTPNTCTITATAAGVSGTTDVTVTTAFPLTVTPSTATLSCTGGARVFFITGGAPEYTVSSTDPNVTISGSPVAASGGSFTATLAGDHCLTYTAESTDVDIIVVDSLGTFETVTLTITNP
jgi:hypothetical protein